MILTWETGGFELALTITLALQANRLTKCASQVSKFPPILLSLAELVLVWDSFSHNKEIKQMGKH